MLYPFKEPVVQSLMSRVPTVSVLEDYNRADVDCINPDQIRGISRMVEHLHDRGHQKIGFLSWKYSVPAPWVERRLGAYVENLIRFNMTLNQDWILNVRPDENLEAEQLAQRVAGWVDQGVTGWVCAADHQAYSLVRDLNQLGVQVPRDCSVTGFDGIHPMYDLPQLSTVKVPFQEIGVSALTTLLRKIENPMAARRHILVSGSEVIGKSTAPPPSTH